MKTTAIPSSESGRQATQIFFFDHMIKILIAVKKEHFYIVRILNFKEITIVSVRSLYKSIFYRKLNIYVMLV